MTSDLPGELGSDPGLDRLFKTLASGPTPEELAGEQQALAMFRTNIHPPAHDTAVLPVPPASAPAPGEPALPARHRAGAIRQRARLRLGAPRARVRLAAAAAAAALVGGFAAAAYAAALPAPVQHMAYQAFHIFGVPNSHRGGSSAGGRNGALGQPGAHRGGSHPGPSHGVSPGASKPSSPGSSAGARSPMPSSGTGTATVTASAAAAQIPAGGSDTIDGQLTRGGTGLSGVTVRLWEHVAGQPGWSQVGQATTGSTGGVAIGVTSLTANAVFRMTDPDGPISSAVRVTVVPEISTTLVQGSAGVRDYVRVTTQFANPGDTVELQAFRNGTWVIVRAQTLNGRGKTTFVIRARRFNGIELRVVLLATRRHAQAVSSPPLTGPAPA
jgi:hypothetical protein